MAVRFSIPDAFVPLLIGKGGSNIKKLQARFGQVRVTGTEVACIGPNCSQAAEEIKRQLAAYNSHISGNLYPQEFLYIMPADQWPYMFCAFENMAVRKKYMKQGPGNDVTLQPYVLAPVPSHPGQDEDRLGINDLTTRIATQHISEHPAESSRGSRGVLDVLLRPETLAFKQRIRDAAAEASKHEPSFDEVKLRVTFGKQIFHKSRSAGRSSAALQRRYNTPEDLKHCEVSSWGDITTMWSEFLEEAASDSMLAVAAGPLIGMREGKERMHVSVHAADVGGWSGRPLGGVVVSLRVDPVAGSCTVHKVKTRSVKPLVVAFLNPRLAGADFRFKLICQNILRDPSAEPHSGDSDALRDAEEAWRYARGWTWSHAKQAMVPPAGNHRFVVDTIRTKTKRGYEGEFAGYTMRLASARIKEEDGEHVGLGVSCPDINTELCSPEGASAEALEALVAICDMLADAS